MLCLNTPKDLSKYFCADDGWLITELHKMGCHPMYRDDMGTYFKKDKKLSKALKKLNIDED